MPWTDWQLISEMKQNLAPNCKGVYEVAAINQDGTHKSIRRACADDPDGLMYIGAGNLCGRVGLLMELARDDCEPKGHHKEFTQTFARYSLGRICGRRLLALRWLECEGHFDEEKKLLKEYKNRTGDIPPGNLKT
jgi:hypothetical protein